MKKIFLYMLVITPSNIYVSVSCHFQNVKIGIMYWPEVKTIKSSYWLRLDQFLSKEKTKTPSNIITSWDSYLIVCIGLLTHPQKHRFKNTLSLLLSPHYICTLSRPLFLCNLLVIYWFFLKPPLKTKFSSEPPYYNFSSLK